MYSDRITRLLLSNIGEEPWERLVRTMQFQKAAREVAEAMVTNLADVNARSWREAAMKSGKGRKIYEALQREIQTANLRPALIQIARRNADLIQSVPERIAQQIARQAQQMVEEGRRPAEIERALKVVAPRLTRAHAQLIARTEISRSESQLTEIRAKNIDIPAYQWTSSADARVRPSHRNLNGVIVFWNEPPNPEALIGQRVSHAAYHAGCIWNCRCLEIPIVSLDELSWPAKLYQYGQIRRVTRAQFAALAGYQRAA
jgi:SPP1 gp7 family putative phage head morphogenesis protein